MPGPLNGLKWLKDHADWNGDDCLIWPMSRNNKGYGQVGIGNGKVTKASRVMCELVHGPPPTPKHQAAHSCGRGHEACVNPRHLSWKTNQQNAVDRSLHGRGLNNPYGRAGKLTPQQVGLLKSRRGKQTQMATAEEFGVSLSLVQYHWHGKERWASKN